MKEDILDAPDRGELVTEMEPLLLSANSPHREELADLALELTSKAASFKSGLPLGVTAALARLVRAMNCYYSNLIEGHNTHPVDIERALRNDYSQDAEKRNLQLEAKAHISVQKWIDEGGLKGRETSVEGLCEIHRRFCGELPDELLWVEDPTSGEKLRVEPGIFRRHDVQVGRHVPVSPGAIPRFLERFEQTFGRLGKSERIIASAAAHHRFLWIHPYLDGNGRVARLMSHAMFLYNLDTGGIWLIARGLARNEARYKEMLVACDASRRNDLDGRGNLSEEALASFTKFFLQTCIDQVIYMQGLMQPDQLRTRIALWAEEEIRLDKLPAKADKILEAVLYRGSMPRGDLAGVLGTTDRHARRIAKPLIDCEVLASDSPKGPLYLSFPAKFASRWMPGLFPDAPT